MKIKKDGTPDLRSKNKGAKDRTWKKKTPLCGTTRKIRIPDEMWDEIKKRVGDHPRAPFIISAIQEKLKKN